MNLSIGDAAREAPDAPGLVTLDRAYSFAELAAMAARRRPDGTRIAAPTIETVVDIYAHLEARRPLTLIHHKLPPGARTAATPRVPDDTLAVVFTSGSTGAPRGVVLSRDAFLASAAASAQHLGDRAGDAWLVALPLAHVGGLAALLRALVSRRPAVFLDRDFDPSAVRLLLARAPLASLVPTQLAAILDDPSWRPAPSVRAILLGGAAAPAPLLSRAASRRVPFLTSYGMTETWGQVATQALARAGDPDAPLCALPGVELRAGTIDAPAPIRVRTPARMTRYLDELETGNPWLETRDLGAIDGDGGLRVIGRGDDVIVTGGENVHPSTVEAVVAAARGVAACCVIGAPDPRWGQIVIAAVVPGPGFDADALLVHCAARLAPYQRPRKVVALAALPLGPTGKIDRRACAQLANA